MYPQAPPPSPRPRPYLVHLHSPLHPRQGYAVSLLQPGGNSRLEPAVEAVQGQDSGPGESRGSAWGRPGSAPGLPDPPQPCRQPACCPPLRGDGTQLAELLEADVELEQTLACVGGDRAAHHRRGVVLHSLGHLRSVGWWAELQSLGEGMAWRLGRASPATAAPGKQWRTGRS